MYTFSFIGRQNVSENAKKSFLGTTRNLTKVHFLQATIIEVCCVAFIW